MAGCPGRDGPDAAAVAGQPVRPARVLARRVCIRTQRCTCTLPDVAPVSGWYWSRQRDDHAPAWRCGRVRPRRVADPAHALEALGIRRYPVTVEDERADACHAGVAAAGMPCCVRRRRPAPAAALVVENLEPGEHRHELVETPFLFGHAWAAHPRK